MRTLCGVLNPLLPKPSTQKLVNVLTTSPAIQNLLLDAGQDGFYAVVVGNPAGVHRTKYNYPFYMSLSTLMHSRQGAVQAGTSFSWPKWKHTGTLWEALAYMAVKGIEDQLPPVVTHVVHAVPEVGSSSLQNTDVDEVDRLFRSVHIESPEPDARAGCTASHSALKNTLPTPRITRSSVPDPQLSEHSVNPTLAAYCTTNQFRTTVAKPVEPNHIYPRTES
ncbi:hypothetical protein PISMIDRAFT_16263 [Pisolithus microcarpus 441]|uniref:Uncharacterized protein n=1 Tax=Pisolithus microcarpus 441 TaxID=765257 RepID=A0A0C9Z0D1_9AGAM|nr:hypothetical protein BKA83DRAFT_16263 [Pisolithus microcarpus]KIK15797.1 hypothetical protein PISMIDRAFT_16263 [Pisolithus microcarpus 441]